MMPSSLKISLKTIVYSLAMGVIILLFSITTNTFATTVQSLTLPLTFEYESNPRLSSSEEQPISRVVLVPNYSLISNQGTDQWSAAASVHIEQSSDDTISQNRSDPSINLGWTHDYETGRFGVTALLNDQSTRVSEFTDSGIVSGDNTRKTRTASVNWLNNLSDRTSLTLNIATTKVMFEGLVTTGLVDFQHNLINAKLNYVLNEQVDIFTQYSFSGYKPEEVNGTNSETISFDLGLTWNVSENLNVTSSAGLNETKSENSSLTTTDESWQAALNMQYTSLRANSNLNLSRSQSPGSTGSVSEMNQITVGWRYRLSEKDDLSLNYNWGQNLTQNKTETQLFSANYTRQISLSWDFILSAEHRVRDDRLTRASSSSAMAGIIYKLPDF